MKTSFTLNNIADFIMKLMLITMALVFLIVGNAEALSKEQKRVLQSGSFYFDVEETIECSIGSTNTTNTPSLGAGESVYVLGDSITVAATNNLEEQITASGFTVAKINADGGRAISTDTAPPGSSGLAAVEEDKAVISGAKAVVVALGTNSRYEDLNVQIPALVKAIRDASTTAPIYWVNLFYTSGTGPAGRNITIAAQAASLGLTIIDASTAGIELETDGTHPTADGSATFADLIALSLESGQVASPTIAGVSAGYDPISLGFPNFPNEGAIASAITTYIKDKFPASPWIGIDASIGSWLVSKAKERGINPLLILAIGKQENGLGTIGSDNGHVKKYFNYFGIKGSSPIDIPNSSYAGFSSPSSGITTFMDTVKENTQGTDRGRYTAVINFYDYLGMHQSGAIAYPGEPLDPADNSGPGGKPDGDRQNGWDEEMKVYTSWDPNKNDGPPTALKYRGKTYNPGIYFTNSINLINELTGLSLSTTPVKGASTGGAPPNTCSAQGTAGSGLVSPNGYAFPLAPQKKIPYATLPCNKANCHAGAGPAFDLSYSGVEGKEVYAIIGGTIESIDTQDPGFCQSIQLYGSDGFYYWYGHVIDVSVAKGDVVTTGQSMAKVATWTADHTCNGTSGASHLHIDRGCTLNGVNQPGGNDNCRDPDFIPFLDALWETLPS